MRRSADDLDPAAAAAGSAEGRLLLIDVREPDEFRQMHPPRAEPVPLGQLAAHLQRLGAAGKPVAFVCRSGSRSAMATRQARQAGIDAHNVTGGMLAWERQRLPLEAGDPARP
ncbi:MAG: rhodanese-like domain-containing protein [Actinobacteria bacterium]|nr:rhodanese-like domain-containing protein [Actinomycetota bacterium]MBS1884649.1 rhodanese-like domain-containing protein [Actinomycetota bacterium]